jgi:acyl carrier protein
MSDNGTDTAHSRCRDDVHAVVAAMAPRPAAELSDVTRLVADLAYDSVRLIELSMALERRFALGYLDEGQLATVSTVGDVVDLVARFAAEV